MQKETNIYLEGFTGDATFGVKSSISSSSESREVKIYYIETGLGTLCLKKVLTFKRSVTF